MLDKIIPRALPEPKPGLFHYMKETEGNYTRFHLRIEPDGHGLLIANATAALRLSSSGVIIARGILEGRTAEDIMQDIYSRFKSAEPDMVLSDINRVKDIISTLANPDDNYPVINLEDPEFSPYEAQLMAPLEADIPIAPPDKILPILDKLWDVAIPHVSFLTVDDFSPDHLVRAVERAEDLGMIVGVRGTATNMAQATLLKDLALAGVDYITLLYVSPNRAQHDAVCGEGDFDKLPILFPAIRELEVCPVAEVPLISSSVGLLPKIFESLSTQRIHNCSFFAIARRDDETPPTDESLPASSLPQVAATIEETSNESDVRYIWQPPMKRDFSKSIAHQIKGGPRCSGDISVRIEPDGAVIPPRGPYKSAGNILTDAWEEIWGNESFSHYREKVESPTRCEVCPGLVICAAACPRDPESWAY